MPFAKNGVHSSSVLNQPLRLEPIKSGDPGLSRERVGLRQQMLTSKTLKRRDVEAVGVVTLHISIDKAMTKSYRVDKKCLKACIFSRIELGALTSDAYRDGTISGSHGCGGAVAGCFRQSPDAEFLRWPIETAPHAAIRKIRCYVGAITRQCTKRSRGL